MTRPSIPAAGTSARVDCDDDAATLRLVWPQWQGATAENIASLIPELPFETARFGYAIGTQVLAAVLPTHSGPSATVPVRFDDQGLERRGGIDAKDVLISQLGAAARIIEEHNPARIVTLGGECSVSIAPFAALSQRYGADLAVIWVDSHPDIGTPASEYHGYHAMAVAVLTGHGDPDVLACIPAFVDPAQVAIAGLHSWTDDDYPNAAKWGIATFSPDDLRESSGQLLEWLRSTGCSKVAIHLDVDVVDSDEVILGLGKEPAGLTIQDVNRMVNEIAGESDVVGLTIAEYIPRQVMQLSRLLKGFPLL